MADFGFVGSSYTAPSIYQDDQECINFYPEIDPTKPQGSRGVIALYPTPGLVAKYNLVSAEVRGMRALSGGQYLIVVSGSTVYSINTSDVVTVVGTLETSSGYVSITDNQTTNNGLTAYIVDGPNRYTWVAKTNVFSTLASSDGPWQGATICGTMDNYIIYNEPNTQNFACTDLGVTTSSARYGTKDGSPDNLVSIIIDHRQIFLLGENTSEVWVDVGNTINGLTTFPFGRVSGTSMQHGVAAAFSVARFAEQFMFVSQDTRGQAIIGAVNGYSFQRLSTHAVEQTLIGINLSDAIAYTYQIEGHEFYVVTFPSIDLTWVYDLVTQMWHKWLYWENDGFHRHRSNCAAFFNGMNLVGDYENGIVYQLQNDIYTDNNNTIKRIRRAPHLVADLQRQYFSELQIQFQPGVGLSNTPGYEAQDLMTENGSFLWTEDGEYLTTSGYLATPGYDPQAMLKWSNDGGSTWSNEHWTSIGKIGRYQNRAIWRRLGWARDRIYEVMITDPVKAVIVSANLKGEGADN